MHIVIVGTKWAENYLKTWQRASEEHSPIINGVNLLLATSTPDYEFKNARALAQNYGVGTIAWDDIIDDDEIKGLVVATLAEAHVANTRAGIESGKHVLCEKPVATSLEDVWGLQQLAQEKSRIFMPGHLMLYHPAYEALCEFLDTIGEISKITATRLFQKTAHPLEPVEVDLMPHDLALAANILPGRRANNVAVTQYHTPGSTTKISHSTQINFTSHDANQPLRDIPVALYASCTAAKRQTVFTVHGEYGRLVFDGTNLHRYDASDLCIVQDSPTVVHPGSALESEPLFRQFGDFIRCIKTGEVPRGCGSALEAVTSVLQSASLPSARHITQNSRADCPFTL